MAHDVDKIKFLGAIVPDRAFADLLRPGGPGPVPPHAALSSCDLRYPENINPSGGNRPARGCAVLGPRTRPELSWAETAQLKGKQVVARRDPRAAVRDDGFATYRPRQRQIAGGGPPPEGKARRHQRFPGTEDSTPQGYGLPAGRHARCDRGSGRGPGRRAPGSRGHWHRRCQPRAPVATGVP